ncbi:hypothetical protein [Hymenobacter fodinae]|uniref:Uncharacterized protein n=1 Tax=Hymenobacter fodinae TaxID=2510796 RepID=A0A4Z0PBI7_9BACT|nr:hypothetical protein [Hymenobacter fodinae]TGE09954.1 hypothetical protein EU556_03775 [Hymenobacter fodinae]
MLLNYIEAFQSLNPNTTKEDGEKPYKPALLLAVLDNIETAQITNNQIHYTPDLIASFRHYHEKLGATMSYKLRQFVYAFFHLRGEGFWQLKPNPGVDLEASELKIDSFTKLQDAVAYARLDLNLWKLLEAYKTRAILRSTLLAAYSPK